MNYAEKLNKITDILSKSQKVNSFDDDNRECEKLAHALLDIKESSEELTERLLPKLTAHNLTEDNIEEILLDIGEELRHILYHIKSTKFYEYLQE